MSAKTVPSLAEFAKVSKDKRKSCYVCDLQPEVRAQVETARSTKSASYPMIVSWLQTLGYDLATKGRVERHFIENHQASA